MHILAPALLPIVASYNQIGLIDTKISQNGIVDLVVSRDYSQDNTLFLLTFFLSLPPSGPDQSAEIYQLDIEPHNPRWLHYTSF